VVFFWATKQQQQKEKGDKKKMQLPEVPPPLQWDHSLPMRAHFERLVGFVANNFDQHVIDILSQSPSLAAFADTSGETALFKALKETNTSETIIFALIRAGDDFWHSQIIIHVACTGSDPYHETLYGRVVPLWQGGSKCYSTRVILTLLSHPTTDIKIKKTNEWRKRPLHKWKHAYHQRVMKAASPRAEALKILEEINFDYFTDVPCEVSGHLRLVSRMFSPTRPVRFEDPSAREFVPNRFVATPDTADHPPTKKSRTITLDDTEHEGNAEHDGEEEN